MNISIEHVTKKIKNATVLKDICLEMKGGTVYGLQGKNGSGKTMLMRAISGLIRPTSGRIVINGEQLHKNISIPRSIGLLLENPSLLPEYDASQNLKLLAKMQGGVPEEEIRQLIRDVGLEDAGHKKVEKYSLGMKQRLGIAAAILGSPDIILLDEPINAIDGEGVEEIRSLILSLKNEKRIIIVACHDKEEMNLLADEIVHLTPKPRGMILTLLLSMLRTFWLRLTASRPQGRFEKPRTEAPTEEPSDTPEDAETKANIAKIVQEVLAQQAAEKAACANNTDDVEDFELQRMISTFKLLRSKGYTLRILPGTPEENEPVFDFAAESIQPAA